MKRWCLSIGTMRRASANGFPRKRGCLIDCRLRRSGNMSAELARGHIFIPVILCPLNSIKMLERVGIRMPDADAVQKKLCLYMSGKRHRTRGVSTICTGTWKSGVKIGMDPTNRIRKWIQLVEQMDCIALRAGGAIRRCSVICVLRIGWGQCLKINTGTSGFGSFVVKCRRQRLRLCRK